MPLALDPNQTFDVVLKSDEAKPEGQRPVFRCRFVSARQWRRLSGLEKEVERLRDEKAGPEAILNALLSRLAEAVSGWSGMIDPETGAAIPYEPEALDRVLTMNEAWELLYRILGGARMGVDDKKKSGPPLPPSTEDSAAADAPDATDRPS
ncbi:MAG TPA: hypothetical protein VFH53_09165 [Phycisphaerae bacterium]|nr:hypothetical protein [Phycisphaerae bacterium]